MLKTSSQEFRKFFLLEFTRELINSFAPPEVIKLNTIIKEEEKHNPEIKRKLISEPTKKIIPFRPPQIIRNFKPIPRPITTGITIRPLPLRLQYLKPIPKEIEINLGKLMPLIKDSSINSIECNGPDRNITINNPNPRSTGIILTKEEISSIINEFTNASRIPLQEGVYKVAAGKFILLAAISEIIGTKFIIRKIPFQQNIIPR